MEGVSCPVSGKPAKADKTCDLHGKTVYFCCPNCVKAFAADKDKFATKAGHQLVATHQAVQVACPISGKGLKEGTEVDVDGAQVGFCCPNCKAKFAGFDTDGQLNCAFGKFEKNFTTQTDCPVSGKAINPACSTEHEGKKVYFCCGKCKKAFEGDPSKFADKL
ncbi:MAG: hypothetical protein KDA42_14095 [Planctomycetales bacterium]|nr:hypothetical protein [Planctomycetales bacterium]